MTQVTAFPLSSLTARLVRRKRSLLLAPPETLPGTLEVEETPSTLGEDIRFFATCYVAGLVFFLIMLS